MSEDKTTNRLKEAEATRAKHEKIIKESEEKEKIAELTQVAYRAGKRIALKQQTWNRRRFRLQQHGIQFYMLVNQFKRVADKIEGLHDRKTHRDSQLIQEGLDYYLQEKELLLDAMYNCLLCSFLVGVEETKDA